SLYLLTYIITSFFMIYIINSVYFCRLFFYFFYIFSWFFFFFFNDTATTEIYTLSLHDALPIFTINVTMRDIKSKNVYSRVNSKATTQWRKTESANGVHLEGVASDNRSS